MSRTVTDGHDFMLALNDAAVAAREERNLPKKGVFDFAVQITAMRVIGVPLQEVADRVRRRLLQESKKTEHTPEVQGYYREAVALIDTLIA